MVLMRDVFLVQPIHRAGTDRLRAAGFHVRQATGSDMVTVAGWLLNNAACVPNGSVVVFPDAFWATAFTVMFGVPAANAGDATRMPLVIAASLAIFWLVDRIHRRGAARSIALSCIVIFASITNVAFLIGQFAAEGRIAAAARPIRSVLGDHHFQV